MIELGVIVGTAPSGNPIVRLDNDNAQVEVTPPKVRVITSTSAGTPAHTHATSVGAIAQGDHVAVAQSFRGQWFLILVY